jgi:hypothetical protein
MHETCDAPNINRYTDAPVRCGTTSAHGKELATLARVPYLLLGSSAAALGLVGIFVPLLPTTVFLLVAAWAFARSSPRLHRALLDHPRLGPPIRHWQAHRCVSRRGKALAVASMAVSFLISAYLLSGSPLTLALAGAVLAIVAAYLTTRPSCSH